MTVNLKSKALPSTKELSVLLKELNKKFGDNAITQGFPKTVDGSVATIARIPTGSFTLDLALGGGIPVGRFTEISGAYSSTKGQPLDAILPTPTGDKRIGDLEVNDYVFGSDGKPTKVTALFDRGIIDTYKVTFSDGSNIVVDTEHLWALDRVNRPRIVLPTKELIDRKLKGYFIPTVLPLQYDLKNPDVNPYLLGMYLADGHSTQGVSREESRNTDKLHCSKGCVISKKERKIVDYLLYSSESTSHRVKEDGVYDFRFNEETKLYSYLDNSKLFGLKSAEKFIPHECFLTSIEFRTELLKGLMDGDGSISKKKSTIFSPFYKTTSKQLSQDIVRLITSLGGITSRTEQVGGYLSVVRVSTPFNPFKFSEHVDSWRVTRKNKRSIQKIVPNGKLPIRCIMVEAQDHLYIADTEYHIVTHNTTQCLHIIRKAQELGYVCTLIDVEGTSDEPFIEALGIDSSSIFYSRPDGMEEACQIILDLQRSGQVHVAILDSIAAMSPNKEQETRMDETFRMGIPQQMLGEFFRKYQANNNRLEREGKIPFTLIATNQLREKIGSYGDPEYCLHYDTPIVFTDGRNIPIGDVVRNKIKGKVWSFNRQSNTFEECDILDWRENGTIESNKEFYTITADGVGSKNGVYSVTVTYDHKLLTDSGWKPANELLLSDKLVTHLPLQVNNTLGLFLAGTLVGDCTVVTAHKNTAYLRLQDSANPEYLKWKISKLNPIIPFEKYPSKDIWRSSPTVEFNEIKKRLKGKRDIRYFLNRYSDLGLAIYYSDDGSYRNNETSSISMKRYAKDTDTLSLVCKKFTSLGMSCTFTKQGVILFDPQGSTELYERICKYIPDSMQYKLPEKYQGKYEDFTLESHIEHGEKYVDITNIQIASQRKLRKKQRFDIKVGNNHNFLAGGTDNGIVVHNTPGGRAKSFAASVDIRFRRGDWIAEGTGENKEFVGQVVKFKIEKNKTFKRMQTGEFDFYFTENEAKVDKFFNDENKEVIMSSVEYGLIEKAGAWFKYKDNKYQGLAKLLEAMQDDEELVADMKKQIMHLAYQKND